VGNRYPPCAVHVDVGSLGHAAAVDDQASACHEVRGGRCEEQRGSSDLAGCGDAPHGGEAGHRGDKLGIAVFAELGAVEAGAERVDLDAGPVAASASTVKITAAMLSFR
jgi:hypothetical protein